VATVILSFKAMFAGKIAADPAGPIAIMAMTAETAKLGWASVLTLCGLISANLAVINLITIPPFDGGQILILAVEGLLRRRLDERLEFAVRVQGLVLVLALFLYLTLKDVSNLVRFGTY
jgi:regulator of sigma E protease